MGVSVCDALLPLPGGRTGGGEKPLPPHPTSAKQIVKANSNGRDNAPRAGKLIHHLRGESQVIQQGGGTSWPATRG